jgi:hypothetical protein
MAIVTDTRPTRAAEAQLPAGSVPAFAYLDWGSIFGGALIASAVGLLLLTFGAALGLSMVSAEPGESPGRWIGIAAGLWFLWVVLSSVGLGAYLAGRLRKPAADATADEVEMRDGVQGLVVWALTVIVGTVMMANGLAGATAIAARAGGAAGAGIAEAMDEPLSDIATTLLRDPSGTSASPESLRSETSAILLRSVTGDGLTDADRNWIVGRVAAETGQSREEIEARVDEAASAAETALEEARAAIEDARRAAVISGFVIAGTLLAAAAAAYFAAAAGGKHRDHSIPLRTLHY